MVKTVVSTGLLVVFIVTNALTVVAIEPAVAMGPIDAVRVADNRSSKPLAPASSPAPQVQQFVADHLPELIPVLKQLEAGDSAQHERAIRDLSRSIQRIVTAQRRDPALYEIELALLKARTRTSLAAARVKVRDSKQNLEALRAAVTELTVAEHERAKYDLVVYQRRLETVTKQIEAAKARVESKADAVNSPESVFQSYLRKAGRSQRGKAAK